MKFHHIYILVFLILCQCKKKENWLYPSIPEKVIIDTLYGNIISDPYRYIENSTNPVVLQWYKNQNSLASKSINNIPNRNKLIEFQTKLKNIDSVSVSNLEITNNDNYFYLKKNLKNNTIRLYYRHGYNGQEIQLLNEHNIPTNYSINYIKPNRNGTLVVVGITKKDCEIGNIVIVDVQNNKLLDEKLINCWPSALGGVRWLPDNSGFTYEYIPETNKESKNYLLNIKTLLHKIGNSKEKDKVLFSKKNNPKINLLAEDFPEVNFKDSSSKYMFASVSGVSHFADYYISLNENIQKDNIHWKQLFKKEDLINKFYITEDSIIYLTAKNAKNFKICNTSLLHPDFDNPSIVIDENIDTVITDFTLTSQGLFFVKSRNGVSAKLYHLDLQNKINVIKVPRNVASIELISKGDLFPDLWIKIEGWLSKSENYKYDFETKNFIKQNLIANIYNEELDNFIIEEIEVDSYDGTKVPLSIIYKKGTKLNGKNRLNLIGYGAFGISIKPSTTINKYISQWVNQNGIYAIAHVRGGNEKGNQWHQGGFKETKPNTWKDFIACTEYLIKEKYTSPDHITASSASGGGILIGRAITERPDLYAAAVVRVGIFNTLRSEFGPNGMNLSKEFGSIKDSLELNYLIEMDAYKHIQGNIQYPAIYLTAGMNDSRVPVWQAGKFAARLQKLTNSTNPILLSVDFEGGHGFDASEDKKNNEIVNMLSFALWQTGHPDYQPKNKI